MNERLVEPDYQLVWPRTLFVSEAADLLNQRIRVDWVERCEHLLEDAFVSGRGKGPAGDLRDVPGFDAQMPGRVAAAAGLLSPAQMFLRDLMTNAESLAEDPVRRPYWRERQRATVAKPQLEWEDVLREYISAVSSLERRGYFESRFGKDCYDGPYEDGPSSAIEQELSVSDLWPLDIARFRGDEGIFFDVVEVLHDFAARPRSRSMHSYAGCGWHHSDFDIGTGRQVYRWQVNKILRRSDLGLELATFGDDAGRLVTATDDARADLLVAVVDRRSDHGRDEVLHAIQLFRARGADRNSKQSAVVALARVLEARRHVVLRAVMASKDRNALFEIANGFNIRHGDAKQMRDYDDFYLDWIFWLYLSTIELTDRILAVQAQHGS